MANKTLAFEIGTEELPAFDLHAATEQLHDLAAELLSEARISYDELSIYSTPRRLIVIARGLPEQTEALLEEFRGPSAAIAFDEAGNLTKAALGFARGKGVDPAALVQRDEAGSTYVYAIKETPAYAVASLLPELLHKLILSISWPKSQRWGSHPEQFSRPVRWLLALFGTEVIPVSFAGLTADRLTYGHRFLAPGPHEITSADDLVDALRQAYVVPSETERQELIESQVAQIEAETGLKAELPAKTMEEVVNLSEYPTVMLGEFDTLFLSVPKEITVDAMLVHQRYFPLFQADGSLSNHFLITSNGNPDYRDKIVDGNQRVVAARLFDAKFFYDEDLKRPLEAYVDRLDEVVFQESLGTVKDKTDRIVALAKYIARNAGLTDQECADAARAAYLCKADLVTAAVTEFTSVQGIMGSYYAAASGENPVVAQAIGDHYRPRFSGDSLPESAVGRVLATADKLDTICGLFAVGQEPTGSSDPFALRRGALGILAMLEAGLTISLKSAITQALASYAEQGIAFDHDAICDAVIDFFVTRTRVQLRDAGSSTDAIDAVLAVGITEPLEISARVHALEAARRDQPDVFDDLATAFARANNLREAGQGSAFDEAPLSDVEQALAQAIVKAEAAVSQALAADDYAAALLELAQLRQPIDHFFEQVMVMDEDPQIRANRMKILNRFVAVFEGLANFGKMAKK